MVTTLLCWCASADAWDWVVRLPWLSPAWVELVDRPGRLAAGEIIV